MQFKYFFFDSIEFSTKTEAVFVPFASCIKSINWRPVARVAKLAKVPIL